MTGSDYTRRYWASMAPEEDSAYAAGVILIITKWLCL